MGEQNPIPRSGNRLLQQILAAPRRLLGRRAPLFEAKIDGSLRDAPARSSDRTTVGAVLFDVDGVITDTAERHTAAWRRLAQEEGLEFSDEMANALRGLSREDSLDRLLNGRLLSYDQFASLMERKNEYYVASLQTLTPADTLPGIVELLGYLRDEGIRTAAVSLSRNAQLVLDRVGLFDAFETIIDGLAQARSRGGLHRYLLAAKALRVDPMRCVVLEDSAFGIALARSAGMKTVGLGCARRLCAADVVFESLQGVEPTAVFRALGLMSPNAVGRLANV